MNNDRYKNSTIKLVRDLVQNHSANDLNACLDDQLQKGFNTCHTAADNMEIINILSRAGYVSQLVDKGISINEAIRELGRRMRILN